MDKFPDLKNEIVLKNNMIALQEFGYQQENYLPQPQFQQPQQPFMMDPFGLQMVPGFPQLQPIPTEMLLAQPMPVEPVPMPSNDIHPLIPDFTNNVVQSSVEITKTKQKVDEQVINIEDATKKVRKKNYAKSTNF